MPIAVARPPEPIRWLGLPILLCIAATLVFALPMRIFGLALPEPVTPMAAVYAWALVRPGFLGPFAVLLLGLFLDLFWGGPMGLWGLSMMAAYAVVAWTRPVIIGQPYAVMWAWYVGSVAVAMAVAYIISEIRAGTLPALIGAGWQFLVTALLYPLCHEMMNRFGDGDGRLR